MRGILYTQNGNGIPKCFRHKIFTNQIPAYCNLVAPVELQIQAIRGIVIIRAQRIPGILRHPDQLPHAGQPVETDVIQRGSDKGSALGYQERTSIPRKMDIICSLKKNGHKKTRNLQKKT